MKAAEYRIKRNKLMHIAFYAPMKPPDHPAPSGDRRMARMLMQAMRKAGHTVSLAARFRSYDGIGNVALQKRHRRAGLQLAKDYIRRHRLNPPDLWFTYHLYHKAPDWIGPTVSKHMDIPYAVAEASNAPKRAVGRWAEGYAGANTGIRAAGCVIGLNPDDIPCIKAALTDSQELFSILPFIDTSEASKFSGRKSEIQRELAKHHSLDPEVTWLLTVAMMRPGAKLDSYRLLSRSLENVWVKPWALLIVGDGPSKKEVMTSFRHFENVRFLGECDQHSIARFAAAADIFVWPAMNEGYGMAILEAQLSGLPIVAGDTRGVAQIVSDNFTGLLTPPGDIHSFASAINALLCSPMDRLEMGKAARIKVLEYHSIAGAAQRLDEILSKFAAARMP